jgi:hypothetical protein
MSDLTEAERLALITHKQVRLVNSEADLCSEYEVQDDPKVHHGHSGRRQRSSAEIIPFPQNGRNGPVGPA